MKILQFVKKRCFFKAGNIEDISDLLKRFYL